MPYFNRQNRKWGV